ncbi:MAG: PAS domain S-box protein, partial [Acidobacteriota bacterium]|nr:PAS domain S-box protein [Acidobacteriota bacterium]
MSERFKILVIAVLIVLSCVLIYYFHAVFKTETIFVHFFYIPVILSSVWWQRKGLFIAVFLALILILSHLLFLSTNISGDIVRAVFLVIISYVIGSISEKKEEEKGKISQIVYGSFMPSFVIDNEHKVVHWNKALESLTGIKEEEIIETDGQWRAFYTEKRPCMADLIVDGASEEEIEKNYKDKYRKSSLIDGAYEALDFFPEIKKWLRFTANSIVDINGEIVGALETLEDITERKRAEQEVLKLNKELELKVEQKTEELTKERDYIRHLMETSPNFQILINKEGEIIDANEAFEEIAGGKVKGTSIYEYLPQEEINKIIHEVSEKGKVKNLEITTDIPGKGGFACNVSATLSSSLNGKPIIYMGGMDITERKKAQQEREKLEMQLVHTSRLSSLGEMATAIAHEINQPLTIISTATEGLLRDIDKKRLDFGLLPQDLGDIMGNVKRIDK